MGGLVPSTAVACLALGSLLFCSPGSGGAASPATDGPLEVIRAGTCAQGGTRQPVGGELRPVNVNVDAFGRPGCVRLVVRSARSGTLELVVARRKPGPGLEARVRVPVSAGKRTVEWRPARGTAVRTYVTRLALVGRQGVVARASGPVVRVRAVSAWFGRSSYPSGAVAVLHVDSSVRRLRLEIVDVGTGARVAPARVLYARPGVGHRVRLGRWRSGVYVATLTTAGGVVGRAPLVVRSASRPRERVAVVMPTHTWQAYNFLDADSDGAGDTWYAGVAQGSAASTRPYQGAGLPLHFEAYDAPFLRWLATERRRAEFLTDDDLDDVGDGRTLARRFDLIVFPGHEEYVTDHVYDVIEEFRDRGGNLAFLTSDAFHWRVRLDRGVMTRLEAWRRLGRPESSLVGVQYRANDDGRARRPYVVRNMRAARWLFLDTGLEVGDTFAPASGIEISRTTWHSPRRTRVLAEIPALYGAGAKAQMTYYATPGGAKVFASGSFSNLAASPVTRIMLSNLWTHLSRP